MIHRPKPDPVEVRYGTVEKRNDAIAKKAQNGATLEALSEEFGMRPKYIREIAGDLDHFPPLDLCVVVLDENRRIMDPQSVMMLPEKHRKEVALQLKAFLRAMPD